MAPASASLQAPADAALEDWLLARHSCRAFQPQPVPRVTIERILSLAQRTASWCNCQPWQVAITEGAELDEVGSPSPPLWVTRELLA